MAALTRSAHDRQVAGVCAGVAQYLNMDPTLVRVAAVVAILVSASMIIPAYVVAWLLIPEEGTGTVLANGLLKSVKEQATRAGAGMPTPSGSPRPAPPTPLMAPAPGTPEAQVQAEALKHEPFPWEADPPRQA